VHWRSLTEPHLDNTTAAGRLMVNVTGAMAQFERDQIIERTKRGMDECRRRGQYLGRLPKFDKKQAASIKRDRRTMNREAVAKKWKCSPGTVDKYAS
jgi:DNA invertase Pin-like site-specific DNA recombinase